MNRSLFLKKFKHLILTLLLIFCLVSQNANAVPIGAISKIIKGIFKKGDEVFDAGKNIGNKSDDLSGINKSEDLLGGPNSTSLEKQLDNINNLEIVNQAGNSNIHSYSASNKIGKILKDHGVDVSENATDLADNFLKDGSTDSSFNPFINPLWYARFLRVSNYYNRNKEEEKKILFCKSDKSNFNFIFIVQEKTAVALLTHGDTLKDALDDINNKKIIKQRLHAIEDLDFYSVLSTQKKQNQNFPQHYFIFYKEQQGFDYYNFPTGTESPETISYYATKGPKQNGKCHLITKDGKFLL